MRDPETLRPRADAARTAEPSAVPGGAAWTAEPSAVPGGAAWTAEPSAVPGGAAWTAEPSAVPGGAGWSLFGWPVVQAATGARAEIRGLPAPQRHERIAALVDALVSDV